MQTKTRVYFIWLLSAAACAISVWDAAVLLAERWGKASGFELFLTLLIQLYVVIFAVPAALIITRQPRNRVGWLLMTPALVAMVGMLFQLYLRPYQSAPPEIPFPLLFLMVWFIGSGWIGLIFPLLLIPLFYPTGRLLSPRWRWAVYLAVGLVLFFCFWALFSVSYQSEELPWKFTNPIGFISDEFAMRYIFPPWAVLLSVLTGASAASIVIRYRRAGPVERQQIKWLAYACTVFAVVYIPSLIYNTELLEQPLRQAFDVLFFIVIAGIPAAISMALLRYRLFDIDVIIRLTLVYALLTGLLGLAYAAGVVLLQAGLRALTGQASNIAVVVTTLAIAALFNPLRARVQGWIDRRFYREKYNTEQALAAFAAAARNGSDLDTLTEMLAEVVQTNLQPAHLSLLLRKSEEKDARA